MLFPDPHYSRMKRGIIGLSSTESTVNAVHGLFAVLLSIASLAKIRASRTHTLVWRKLNTTHARYR